MTAFRAAVMSTPRETTTTNGMPAYQGSTSPLVDLFFTLGAARNAPARLVKLFYQAFGAAPDLALKTLFWARDVRGGAGERQSFRTLLVALERTHPRIVADLLKHVPFYGRWDDLLATQRPETRGIAMDLIAEALRSGDALCAKWMPRQGPVAAELAHHLGLSARNWRKLLVARTRVVESAMCAQDWGSINFSHVPSLAAARYQTAFNRNAKLEYRAYKEALATGGAKVNAAAIFPHEVLHALAAGDVEVASAQWAALPNYLGNKRILPMVDVSGSMLCPLGAQRPTSFTCMDVSVALGLYLADKQQGAFKDVFLTFSSEPNLGVLQGDLPAKVQQLYGAAWGGSTDIMKGFHRILDYAVANQVPAAEMPDYLLILSDMQFDAATAGHTNAKGAKRAALLRKRKATALAHARAAFAAAGYTLPHLVFWNLNAQYNNTPVTQAEDGTALVSGFSPAILKSVLAARTLTPFDVMMDTLTQPRYARVTLGA